MQEGRYHIVDSDTAKTTEPYASVAGVADMGLPTIAPDLITGVDVEIPRPIQLVFDTQHQVDGIRFLGVLLSDPDIFVALNTLAEHVGNIEARLGAAESLLGL